MLRWLRKRLGGSGRAPAPDPDALVREALAFQAAGRLEDAERGLYRALALAPDSPLLHLHLARLFGVRGRHDAALDCCRAAVRLAPGFALARNDLGNALRAAGRTDEAFAEYREAVALDPGLAEAQFNLGVFLQCAGRADEALACYDAALRLRPGFAAAQLNRGLLLEEREDTAGAISAYRGAIAAESGMVEAHVNLGMQLLLAGDWAAGWEAWEWRLRYPEYSGADLAARAPRWTGEPLAGRRILLEAEAGFGDAIQFLRFAPRVAALGGRVRVRCAPELAELAANVDGVEAVVARGALLPEVDCWCPLPSLPRLLAPTPDRWDDVVPYLRADPAKAARWRARLAAGDAGAQPRLRVGLAWASQSGHRTAADKSVPFAALAPLAAVGGLRFYSLQKGPAAGALRESANPLDVVDLADELADFSDTAAAMAGLDLVISVDTAVAHLAGALGKPAWTMLKVAPDWRWMLGREDSPWYPTMRLYRQSVAGDWSAPVQAMARAMERRARR